MPFLRGAFLGVLTEMRRMKADDLAAELTAYARGGVEQQVVAGDFLHGVLKVSKTAILLGAKSLVAAVNELLAAATGETFLGMVPRLRAAFETLHERQRDAMASHVAELYGLKEGESLRTLSTSVVAAALMAQLDAEVAAIMKEWLGES
jgi:flagellar motility protein MotE (MotC chaperone)